MEIAPANQFKVELLKHHENREDDMPLKTGRAYESANVTIDRDRCTGCGLCAKICKGAPLYMDGKTVLVDQTRLFGCIACGQCVAVCPQGCITVDGRDFSPSDVIEMPPSESHATYDQLKSLMLSRRSVRDFQNRDVEPELIEKILAAASTSPMGAPPSDVEVLVLSGKDKVAEFKDSLVDVIRSYKWMFSPLALALMRPFIGKDAYDSYKSFLVPVLDIYTKQEEAGQDWFFYGAPLAMFFYTSPLSDPVDPIIPATYAMLAAHSLGLGSCMLGFPAFILKYSKKVKQKYDLPPKFQPGVMVIFGYSDVKYQRALVRRFAKVRKV